MRADAITTDEPCELCHDVPSSVMVSGVELYADDQDWIGSLGCQRLMVCDDCLSRVYEPIRAQQNQLTEDLEWLE